jgi:hypothetical protein
MVAGDILLDPTDVGGERQCREGHRDSVVYWYLNPGKSGPGQGQSSAGGYELHGLTVDDGLMPAPAM